MFARGRKCDVYLTGGDTWARSLTLLDLNHFSHLTILIMFVLQNEKIVNICKYFLDVCAYYIVKYPC